MQWSIRILGTPPPRQSCQWTGANEAIQERKTWREKWKDVLGKCHLIDMNITWNEKISKTNHNKYKLKTLTEKRKQTMEYCTSNETKSGNPCFELNIEKYNSTVCSHTAKIKGSPFFTPPPFLSNRQNMLVKVKNAKKGWQCVPIREEGNKRERGYAGEAEPGVEQVGQPS